MSNNTNPIKDLLGPLYEVAVATGEWLGNQLDKKIDEILPRE